MICEIRNITLPNERYALNTTAQYNVMTSVPSGAQTISGLSMPQRINDSAEVINSTYWRLHVNESTNPFGICNGTVVFAAIAP